MAMGTRSGPSCACLFVGYVEQSLFYCYTVTGIFLRYIDDWSGAASCYHEELEQFINFTNTFHTNLKFTWAICDTSLPFLDLSVFISECLLQNLGGVIVASEEAQDGHVTQGMGGAVKMVDDRKVLSFFAYRVQMLYKTFSKSMLGLTDVEKATLGAVESVDQVGRCTSEPLSDLKGLLWASNGGEGGGVGA
eukprot:g43896.t1